MKKRILIPYASYGSGHKAIAEYISSYFKEQDPELEIKTIDLLNYSIPIIGRWSQKTNGYLMLKIPFLHGLVYRMFDSKISGSIADNVSMTLFKNKSMKKFISEFNPDLTIATHFFGSSLITYYNKKGIINSKLITVVTDYEAHELWINDYKTDNYIIVGDKSEVPTLVKRGIEKSKIKPIGIPIAPQTKTKFNKEASLKKYKFSGLRPICIFFGGGGNGSTASLPFIKKIIKSDHAIDIIFIAGKNEKSRHKVEEWIQQYKRTNIRTIGFADNVPELLQLCDFVISKPGGAQSTECLYFNKPILMINSSGGQEVANYKLFTNNGYGKRFRTSWGLNHFIAEIIKNPAIIYSWQKNMSKNKSNLAMENLYKLTEELLKSNK